jgi:hypothetical protein
MNAFKCIAVFLLVLSFAHAGVYMEGTDTNRMQNQESTTKIYVDKDRLRVETTEEGRSMVIIFRQDKNLFWVVDNDESEYREMTKEDLQKMKMQLDEGMKKMQEQLKNLPPEQRKMMESMMPATMNVKKLEQSVYSKVESGVKINSWTCDHYVGKVDDQKKQDVWATDWSQTGISADDLQAFRGMGEFFKSLAPDMTDVFKLGDEEFEKQGGYAGIPIKTIDYQNGKVFSEFVVNQIVKKDLDQNLFEIPQGYEKVDNELQGMQ